MFADKLLRKNKKIRQACKVEGKILSIFSLSLYIRKVLPVLSGMSLPLEQEA